MLNRQIRWKDSKNITGARENFDPRYQYNLQQILDAHMEGSKKENIEITGINSKLSVTDLATFNDKLQEIISMEPSPSFVTNKIFRMYERSCFGKGQILSYKSPGRDHGMDWGTQKKFRSNSKKSKWPNFRDWYDPIKAPPSTKIVYGPYSFDNVIPYPKITGKGENKITHPQDAMKGFQRFPTAYDAGDMTTCTTESWGSFIEKKKKVQGKEVIEYKEANDYLTYYKWFKMCNVPMVSPTEKDSYADKCRDPNKMKKIPRIKYGLLEHIVQRDFNYEVSKIYSC